MAALKPGPEAVHFIAEAGRLAYADRALYLADPAFVNVPVRGLLDPGYLKGRAALIDPRQIDGPRQARRAAVPEELSLRAVGRHRVRHQPHVDRGRRRSRGRDDDDDRGRFRLPPDDEERLPAQQRTDRFLLRRRGGRQAGGEPGRGGQAPALLDGADDRVRFARASSTPPSARRGAARSSTTSPRPSSASSTGSSTRRSPRTCRTSAAATARPSSRRAPRPKPGRRPSKRRATRCRLIEQNSGIHAIVVTPAGLVGGADSRREGVAIGN